MARFERYWQMSVNPPSFLQPKVQTAYAQLQRDKKNSREGKLHKTFSCSAAPQEAVPSDYIPEAALAKYTAFILYDNNTSGIKIMLHTSIVD